MASASDPFVLRTFCSFWFIIISRCVVVLCSNDTESSTINTTVQSFTSASSASTETPEPTLEIHLNETVIASLEEELDDSGRLAGIVIGILGGFVVGITAIIYVLYRQCIKRNVTSMNFDNPVYRKTTEDQFSLEKNQYHPAGSYPPSLEPLTSPGTNEFV